jgi:hypothetical protein
LIRLDEAEVAKEILESNPGDRIKVGRPKHICLEQVKNDLRELEVKKWTQLANN